MLITIIVLLVLSYAVFPTYILKLKTKLTRKKEGRTIYLTFDDGPSLYTNELLDLLAKYHLKASFFCLAKSIEEHPDIIKRIKEEGHLIGFHSYNHISAYLLTPKKTNLDFKKCAHLAKTYNIPYVYYRPPWGILNIVSLINIKKYHLKLTLWHVMIGDWKKNATPEFLASKLLKKTKCHDIICLHDGRGTNNAPKRTIEALRIALPKLLAMNYKFERVDNYEK